MRGFNRLFSGLLAAGLVLAAAPSAQAAAILPGFDSVDFPGNDDGSTGLVNIGFTINFFGVTHSQLYVNNNGNVTFDPGGPLGTFTPFELTPTGTEMIAPFFADVDTRAGNITRYGGGTVGANTAFGVTWLNVGYYGFHTDLLNSFQLLLVNRPDTGSAENFDFIFNYDQILWETGDASSGSGGCGGVVVHAGYSNGVDTAQELAGSGVGGAFVDAASPCNGPAGANQLTANSRNSDVLGRYVFEVRNGLVIDPNANAVPEPTTVVMFGTGLAMLVGVARRRKQ